MAASILPKSVTTPIAMAVSQSIGGIPAVTAVCVIFVEILGAVFVHNVFKLLRLSTQRRHRVGWQWAPRLTLWAPSAAPNWIFKKGHSVRWR